MEHLIFLAQSNVQMTQIANVYSGLRLPGAEETLNGVSDGRRIRTTIELYGKNRFRYFQGYRFTPHYHPFKADSFYQEPSVFWHLREPVVHL